MDNQPTMPSNNDENSASPNSQSLNPQAAPAQLPTNPQVSQAQPTVYELAQPQESY
jgi:hypothetical protein